MAIGAKNIAAAVRKLLEEKINGLGYEVWDVEYVKEGAEYHLRVTIDSPDGIYINDCEKVHHFIDPILDEADPIEDAYILEVSSPGIERELRLPAHFTACIGEKVTLKLYTALDGQKKLTGTMTAFDGTDITLSMGDGSERVVPRQAVSRATLYYEF